MRGPVDPEPVPMVRLRFLLLVGALVLLLAPSASADASTDGNTRDVLLTLDGPLTGDRADALRARGLADLQGFDVAPVVAADGSPSALEAAAGLPFVLEAVPSEPLEAHLDETREAVAAEGPYRERGLDGTNVTVAVVDSGIDADHPAFQGRVEAGRSFDDDGTHRSRQDDDGHGSHIAGIVGGSGARSDGGRLRGLAPSAGLVGLDISDPFTTENALRAFEWIHDHHDEHGIRVVTNSWGRAHDDPRYDPDDPLIRAANGLVQDGLVVVFSAGNQGPDRSSLTVEAMNPNVLTVGATDKRGRVAEYSSRGPPVGEDGQRLGWTKPDLVAPGTGVTSVRTQDTDGSPSGASPAGNPYYVTMNGTSMAAPHVAGAAALLLDEDPTLTPLAVEAVLEVSAADRGPSGPDPSYGHGFLRVETALRTLEVAREGKAVVETRKQIPVEAEGRVTGARGHVVAEGKQAHVPPRDAVETPFEVPARAVSANLSFRWEDDGTEFTVALDGPRGSDGPHQPDAGASRVWANVTGPVEGDWTLEAEPGDPTRTRWRVDGHVTVLETKVVDGADDILAERVPSLRGSGGIFDDTRGGTAALDALGEAVSPAGNPVAVALGMASALGGVLVRLRRSR